MLVLHYTGMQSVEAALARLCDKVAKVSAHYVVDEDGTLYTLVDEQNRAWHVRNWFNTWAQLGWICAPESKSLISSPSLMWNRWMRSWEPQRIRSLGWISNQ